MDDNSSDNTESMLKDFPEVTVIRHNRPLFVGHSINDGICKAKSNYVAIIDDDNVVSPRMIEELYFFISGNAKIGVTGPITFYKSEPQTIMYTGALFSRLIRRTSFIGANQIDVAEFSSLPWNSIPNCFMIRGT